MMLKMNFPNMGYIQLEDMICRSRLFFEGGIERVSRGSISRNRKEIILQKGDGLPCPICNTVMRHCHSTRGGNKLPNAVSVEHVLPLAMGGNNDFENIIPMCKICNRIRGQICNEMGVNTPEGRDYSLQWLWQQLHPEGLNVVSTKSVKDIFPTLEGEFWKRWKAEYGRVPAMFRRTNLATIEKSTRRRLDMSASARFRRPSQRDSKKTIVV